MTLDFLSIERLASEVMAQVPEAVVSGETPAALYGLGFLGRFALGDLAAAGIRFDACYDGNPQLSGTHVQQTPVYAAGDIAALRPNFVFISARHAVAPISARLAELGLAHVSVDAYYAARDLAAFREIHGELLPDERSQTVLRAVLATMLTGARSHVSAVFEKDQYFCLADFCGVEKEVFVDAGAYVGDSLERFIWTHYGVFDKAICFEPGMRQFRSLANRRRRLLTEWALDESQITIVASALGETAMVAKAASQSGDMTSLALEQGGDQAIRIDTLDAYLAGERVSFIKADVEGMEMALLRGAAETIRAHRPKLAICVYHYPSDIPVISQYLKSLTPDYRFALRHHSPQFLETVLYAWVEA